MMSEIPACPAVANPICSYGLMILVLFFLSTFFVDSMLQVTILESDKKKVLLNFILCLPYIILVGYVIYLFFTSISVLTVEYILSLKTIYSAAVYGAIFGLNTIPVVRKINTIFMVSFFLSFMIFILI